MASPTHEKHITIDETSTSCSTLSSSSNESNHLPISVASKTKIVAMGVRNTSTISKSIQRVNTRTSSVKAENAIRRMGRCCQGQQQSCQATETANYSRSNLVLSLLDIRALASPSRGTRRNAFSKFQHVRQSKGHGRPKISFTLSTHLHRQVSVPAFTMNRWRSAGVSVRPTFFSIWVLTCGLVVTWEQSTPWLHI